MPIDKADSDNGPITDATVNGHMPLRQVISVNGEEEDVENINIHDFTTFEQEELIGPEFIGKLKRKSLCMEAVSAEKSKEHMLSTFRSAVRAVLTTEAIMQVMKHYNHRSDSETEEDEDDSRTPAPAEVKSSQFDAGINQETVPPTDSHVSRNPDLPLCLTSAPSIQNTEEPDISHDKPSEVDTAVNSDGSPSSVEKPDGLTSPTLDSSVTVDSDVELSVVQLVDTEAASPARTANDAESGNATLSAPATLVVDDSSLGEMRVGDSIGSAAVPSSEPTIVAESLAIDTSDSKALLEEVEMSQPQTVEPAVTAAANDSDDADTSKPTDGLLTPTDRRPTETTDTGCRCCSVQ